ncbi:MAG: HEAT repeat domain-containing protein [Planctomycetota bacterium]|nr:HEAT repeat domain-containing protein [Planctomycetota bacterium]
MEDDAITTLVRALHDDREGLRQFAMRRLVNMGPRVIPALIDTLKDTKECTQECAAVALTTFGSTAVPYLLEAMNSEDRRTRWGAAWVMATMGPEARNAVPPVCLPAAEAAAPEPATVEQPTRKYGSGVWSDSWLTKVREQLNAAKKMDLLNPGGANC